MSLTGWPFLLLLLGIAAAVAVAVYVLWNRWPTWSRLIARSVSLVVMMAMGAAVAGTLLNRSYDFYASFSDLFGRPPNVRAFGVTDQPKASAGVDILTPDWLAAARAAARHGRGSVLQVRLPGLRSGISRDGEVYLPAAYFSPGHRDQSFAVIELFHGYPGHPEDFARDVGSRDGWTLRSLRAAFRHWSSSCRIPTTT